MRSRLLTNYLIRARERVGGIVLNAVPRTPPSSETPCSIMRTEVSHLSVRPRRIGCRAAAIRLGLGLPPQSCMSGQGQSRRIFRAEKCSAFRFRLISIHVGELSMARPKIRDIAWESAATIRGKNPRAWRRDGRGNRIRYGSFETYGKYSWTVQRGKPVSSAQQA
jgi:hypothetical protein